MKGALDSAAGDARNEWRQVTGMHPVSIASKSLIVSGALPAGQGAKIESSIKC